jgi:hypothetical protein
MWIVTDLQKLSRRQTIIVNMLFAAGFLASIAGVIRTYFTWVMTTTQDYDVTWHAYAAWLSSSVELYVGVVRCPLLETLQRNGSSGFLNANLLPQLCASIPATRPFFGRYLPRLYETTTSFFETTTGRRTAGATKGTQATIDSKISPLSSSASSSPTPPPPPPGPPPSAQMDGLASRPLPVYLNKPLPPINERKTRPSYEMSDFDLYPVSPMSMEEGMPRTRGSNGSQLPLRNFI